MMFIGPAYKKGAMEFEELIKVILIILVVIVILFAIVFLLWGKGGELLSSIKDFFRFGG